MKISKTLFVYAGLFTAITPVCERTALAQEATAEVKPPVLDAELLKTAKEEKLNLFLDATDVPEGDSSSIQAFQTTDKITIERTKRLGNHEALSVLSYQPQTLLFWRRPDVLTLARRIVKGENIQLLELSKETVESINVQADNIGDTANKNLAPLTIESKGITTSELLLLPVLREIEAETGKNPAALPNEAEAGETRIELSAINERNRLITGTYTQYYLLRDANSKGKDVWMTDEYWKGVNLIIRQMPNQVIRRADVGKPRTTIPVLSVTGNKALDDQRSLQSNKALAVLPSTP